MDFIGQFEVIITMLNDKENEVKIKKEIQEQQVHRNVVFRTKESAKGVKGDCQTKKIVNI